MEAVQTLVSTPEKESKPKAQNPYLSVSVQERRVEQDLNRRTKIGDEPANCC